MNYDLLSIIAFYLIVFVFYLRNKKKFIIQGKFLALYKTKIGLKLMDKIAKKMPRTVKYLGYFGVICGYAGMIFIFVFLIKETLKFLLVPSAPPPLAPVLPGISIPGAPKLSFWHWIISIFVVAVVHEFSHGVVATFHKIKIKSSGFAFMGPILLAFVEPDEKMMKKEKVKKQLAVFSAGPFSNLLLGALMLLTLNYVIAPVILTTVEPVDGVLIKEVMDDYPAQKAGLTAPFIIREVNGVDVVNLTNFFLMLDETKPGDEIELVTDKGDYNIVAVPNPENKTRPFIGVGGISDHKVKENLETALKALLWINLLFLWLFIINLGVGLFNLLPLGMVDGGRIFYITALAIFKEEKKAKYAWKVASAICLALIVINLGYWLIKLAKFLIKPLLFLIALIL
ncbi:site-2 protease family protein [Candidatus Woesearchaeota archaeon]|nr:site-2 protease family protein [Candidatus Woesearchaeota archaeon]